MTQVACIKCGWVHIVVEPSELTEPTRSRCFRFGCGGTKFRLSKPGDAPMGSTLQAIVLDPKEIIDSP